MRTKEQLHKAILEVKESIQNQIKGIDLEFVPEQEYKNITEFCDTLMNHLEELKDDMMMEESEEE